MIFYINTDGDSGMKDLDGNWLKASYHDENYIFVLSDKDVEVFISAFKERKLGISDKVFTAFEPHIDIISYCLRKKIDETINSSNYSISIFETLYLHGLHNVGTNHFLETI